MQLPRSDPQRGHVGRQTQQAIQEDYDKFVEDGSCTLRQKFFHNVIYERLLDIDLDKVIIITKLFFEVILNYNTTCFLSTFNPSQN